MTTHAEVKYFIRKMKARKTIKIASIYSDLKNWDLYYDISGLYLDNYFNICFMKLSKNDELSIEIAHTTDQKEQFKKTFKLQ